MCTINTYNLFIFHKSVFFLYYVKRCLTTRVWNYEYTTKNDYRHYCKTLYRFVIITNCHFTTRGDHKTQGTNNFQSNPKRSPIRVRRPPLVIYHFEIDNFITRLLLIYPKLNFSETDSIKPCKMLVGCCCIIVYTYRTRVYYDSYYLRGIINNYNLYISFD